MAWYDSKEVQEALEKVKITDFTFEEIFEDDLSRRLFWVWLRSVPQWTESVDTLRYAMHHSKISATQGTPGGAHNAVHYAHNVASWFGQDFVGEIVEQLVKIANDALRQTKTPSDLARLLPAVDTLAKSVGQDIYRQIGQAALTKTKENITKTELLAQFQAAFKAASEDLRTRECPICFEEMVDNKARVNVCGHEFHKSCIVDWLERDNTTCPFCRATISAANVVAVA